MLFATVPEAPPTTRNQRATSCPAPISAKEPNLDVSRFSDSALRCVSSFSVDGISRLRICPMQEICQFGRRATYWNDEANLCLVDVALPVFGHRCRHVDCANEFWDLLEMVTRPGFGDPHSCPQDSSDPT